MVRRVLIAVASSILAAAAAAVYVWNDRPDLEAYAHLRAPRWNGQPGVTVTFLGVSTLLVSDGETHLMTDGFFSRPGLWKIVSGAISPSLERIAAGLELAGVHRLAAVIALHSHYDHAMDSPEVAERTGAVLIGSPSTANIARGWGLADAKMIVPEAGVPMTFGAFDVTLIESRHLPHGFAEGEIERPIEPPAAPTDYRQGETYVLHVRHPAGTLAIVGSAGFVEGALAPYRADTVLLGIGGLSAMTDEYRRTYYDEVLGRLSPQRVLPIHWDDFTRPLSESLVAAPRLLDDLDQTMRELTERAAADGFALQMPRFAEPVLILDGAGLRSGSRLMEKGRTRMDTDEREMNGNHDGT